MAVHESCLGVKICNWDKLEKECLSSREHWAEVVHGCSCGVASRSANVEVLLGATPVARFALDNLKRGYRAGAALVEVSTLGASVSRSPEPVRSKSSPSPSLAVWVACCTFTLPFATLSVTAFVPPSSMARVVGVEISARESCNLFLVVGSSLRVLSYLPPLAIGDS